ncbi:hypothetical protein SEMRO_2545_G330780.1 [Seminavis robusta]|uniref:Uncharacterized protein n=1 Tax=Seminavis robusta TaxID=568900 RepID=A0A9N8EZ93_9STRA|nr:hypothetical protein SEMRO_2545_G330780.1 [Seminavis robusta]|eukprot:Sro2545_g330780.1 n/a (144) ;mRNA; r:5491-5922
MSISWRNLAASSPNYRVEEASSNGGVEIQDAGAVIHEFRGALALQQYGSFPLFRIVNLNKDNQNTGVLCLPADCVSWKVQKPRKVIGANSGVKAFKTTVTFPAGNAEGYDKIVVTLPFHDDESRSAVEFFTEALVFAGTNSPR